MNTSYVSATEISAVYESSESTLPVTLWDTGSIFFAYVKNLRLQQIKCHVQGHWGLTLYLNPDPSPELTLSNVVIMPHVLLDSLLEIEKKSLHSNLFQIIIYCTPHIHAIMHSFYHFKCLWYSQLVVLSPSLILRTEPSIVCGGCVCVCVCVCVCSTAKYIFFLSFSINIETQIVEINLPNFTAIFNLG